MKANPLSLAPVFKYLYLWQTFWGVEETESSFAICHFTQAEERVSRLDFPRIWHPEQAMAFLQGGEFLFVEKPARIKDFHKSQQPFSIPTWGRAKFPLALLLQLWPALQRANADSGQGLLGNLRAKPAWGWGGAG